MSPYVILTDSSSDIERGILNSWGVDYISLTLSFTDEPDKQFSNDELPIKDFYAEMRAGRVAKTAAINKEIQADFFRKYLDQGQDILCISFSSGLSTTYNSARLAAEELKSEYPERKVIVIDSLCASTGLGLLVYMAVQKKNEGAALEELAEFVEDRKLHICHWFTVDDLVYLKRGGRVSAAAAFFGGLLGIKPVMHVDNEGHLIPMSKVKGRKASLNAILDKYGELALDPEHGTVFICHGDCRSDADYVDAELKRRFGNHVEIFSYTGTVIGAHSGPGTFALFFEGKER